MAGDIRTHVPWGKCDAECRELRWPSLSIVLQMSIEKRPEPKVSEVAECALDGAGDGLQSFLTERNLKK